MNKNRKKWNTNAFSDNHNSANNICLLTSLQHTFLDHYAHKDCFMRF